MTEQNGHSKESGLSVKPQLLAFLVISCLTSHLNFDGSYVGIYNVMAVRIAFFDRGGLA